MNKKVAKIVVNSLTLSRIIGTIFLPVLISFCSPINFILIIGCILFTDFLDGALARKYNVSTILGSILDMSADKLFGIALLIGLIPTFPIMVVPLCMETLISLINVDSVKNNGIGKSSQLGRIKTWVLGLSMFSLLIIGYTPELLDELKKVDSSTINNILSSKMYEVGLFFDNIKNNFLLLFGNNIFIKEKDIACNLESKCKDIDLSIIDNVKNTIIKSLDKIKDNKDSIKEIVSTSTIVSEVLVASDYVFKNKNTGDNKKSYRELISELKANKEFIKSIMLDEEYYKKTKDEPLVKKLTKSIDK